MEELPSSKFCNATKELAKGYYSYVFSDKRRISKSIIDLQAALEICTDSLEEFDRLATQMNSLSYAMFGLEHGLYRTVSELIVIRDEISDLLTSLKASEKFNLLVLAQLVSLEQDMGEGIASGNAALGKSKMLKNNINLAPEHYMIPNSTKTTLHVALNSPEPKIKANSGLENLIESNPSAEIGRLNWMISVQRDLSDRHSEFSFLLIGLWTEAVYDNSMLDNMGDVGCFSMFKATENNVSLNDDKELFLAHKGRIDDAAAAINSIQAKTHEIGTNIYEELEKLRKTSTELKLQHRELSLELSRRRCQLVDCLLATHSAVQSLLELDEKNDALVGKLVKTRPLFAELHRAIVNNDLEEEAPSMSLPGLAEVLGHTEWNNLVKKMANMEVPLREHNQNAAPYDSELSMIDNLDA